MAISPVKLPKAQERANGPLLLSILLVRANSTACTSCRCHGARLVAANLDGYNHWWRSCRAFATLCQKVDMPDVFGVTFSLASIKAVAAILTP